MAEQEDASIEMPISVAALPPAPTTPALAPAPAPAPAPVQREEEEAAAPAATTAAGDGYGGGSSSSGGRGGVAFSSSSAASASKKKDVVDSAFVSEDETERSDRFTEHGVGTSLHPDEDDDLEKGNTALLPHRCRDRSRYPHSAESANPKRRGGLFGCGRSDRVGPDGLAAYQRIAVDKKAMKISINALRFGIFADAVNATILQPNFPIMVLQGPGAHPDSFPSTGPFDFGSAQYFIPMTALLGVAIASVFIGTVSDRIGRKPCIMFCLWGSVVGSIVKYFLRGTFWGFCAANFANGLVSGTVPVAIAYAGDVYTKRAEKDGEIGWLVAFNMLGTSGGGIAAILMETTGLFTPLWLGAGVMFLASMVNQFLLIEPNKEIVEVFNRADDYDGEGEDDEGGGAEEEEEEAAPEKLDGKVLTNVVIGALFDNLGSTGLMPLCLSPLAFEVYNLNFVNAGSDPIMSQIAYKWISVLVALMVIPSTLITPPVFNRIGVAGGCVMGNVITGVATIILLYIATGAPASGGTFGAFVALLYLFFPFTVISQLSTGPMLDVISPVNKRGFTQGINITVMNVGGAVAPWAFGQLSDSSGVSVAIWTCIGISFAAALINVPLMFFPGFGPRPPPAPEESKPLLGEDKELVEKVLRGEWIPAETLEALNSERRERGRPYLVVRYGKYEDDRERLRELRMNAQEDFRYYLRDANKWMGELNKGQDPEELRRALDKANKAVQSLSQEDMDEVHREMGQWFADYIRDSGYIAHTSAQLTKQMIMSAFPVITHDREYTPENVEHVVLNAQRLYRNFVDLEEDDGSRYNVRRLLTAGRASQFMRRRSSSAVRRSVAGGGSVSKGGGSVTKSGGDVSKKSVT